MLLEGVFLFVILIGYSMGGVIVKLILMYLDNMLWDIIFIEFLEVLLVEGDEMLWDIFIFNFVYKENMVFFFDMLYWGLEIVNSFIGLLGFLFIIFFFSFKVLFKNFIEKVGVIRLIVVMFFFL